MAESLMLTEALFSALPAINVVIPKEMAMHIPWH